MARNAIVLVGVSVVLCAEVHSKPCDRRKYDEAATTTMFLPFASKLS